MHKFVLLALLCGVGATGAFAQQQAATPTPNAATTGDLLAQGYEIKGVINNTYMLLQKGNRAFMCGTADNLTWTNWAEVQRDAPCKPLTKAN